MKFIIAIVATDGAEQQILELHGPLVYEARATVLAEYMNGRLAEINDKYEEDTGYRVEALVAGVRPVKVKHAATIAQAFFEEIGAEPTPHYRGQEVVDAPLLNDPVNA